MREVLKKVRREEMLEHLVWGLLAAGSLLGALLVVAIALDRWGWLPAWGRIVLLGIWAALEALLVARLLLLPALRRPSLWGVARAIDQAHPGFHDQVTAAFEFSDEEVGGWGYSRELMEEVRRRAVALLEGRSPRDLCRAAGLGAAAAIRRWAPRSGALLGAVALCVLLSPQGASRSLLALLHPLDAYRRERAWDLTVSPGDTSLVRGSPLTVAVAVGRGVGATRLRPVLRWRGAGEPWREESLPVRPGGRRFARSFPKVSEPLEYQISEGPRSSPLYRVEILDPPAVTRLKVRYEPPAYTGLPAREVLDPPGEIAGLRGTLVTLEARSNVPLARGELLFQRRGDLPLALEGDRGLRGQFRLEEDDASALWLLGRDGLASPAVTFRPVRVLPDKVPVVEVVTPPEGATLPEDLKVPLQVRTTDDFGVMEVRLVARRISALGEEGPERREPLRTWKEPAREREVATLWDLGPWGLSPGDALAFWIEAVDNDAVSGPKVGRSAAQTLRFPTLAEIFRAIEARQDSAASGIEEVRRGEEELKEMAEELRRQVGESKALDWERQREAERLAARQEELLHKAEELAQEMREAAAKAEGAEIFTAEVLRKMEEVARLLEEVATPAMREALRKVQEALQRLDPELLKKALDQFRLSQGEFLQQLDRTLEALRKLELEQRMEALARQAEELLERQEAVNAEMQPEPSAEGRERLAGEEERLAREAEDLLSAMAQTSEMLQREDEGAIAGEMEEARQRGEEEGVAEVPRDAAADLRQGAMQSARQRGKTESQTLTTLSQALRGMGQRLTEEWKEKVQKVVEKAVADLLELSHGEEEVARQAQGGEDLFAPAAVGLARREQELVEGVGLVAEELAAASEESFFLSPEISAHLGRAMARMRAMAEALAGGTERPAGPPAALGREAYGALNSAVAILLEDRAAIQSSASGTGIERAFQRMEEMAQQQSGINEGMANLFPHLGPGSSPLSPQEQQMLARLGAQQRQVQEGLESLGEALGERRDILGRLDELAREAGEVARDMEDQGVSRETLERQERILSRLLDAQRSLREKDYSRRRRAERPEPFVPVAPPEISAEALRREGASVDRLLEDWQGQYPAEYEELIRAYLEALGGDGGVKR